MVSNHLLSFQMLQNVILYIIFYEDIKLLAIIIQKHGSAYRTRQLCLAGSFILHCMTRQGLSYPTPFTPTFWGFFLAHLSRRLTGELIVYPCSGVRPSSVRPSVVRRSQFQRSSPLKPLGQSKPNFMWSILRKGERKFI